jgi:hypothetical protein
MSLVAGIPGRTCPIDYRYGASALSAPATLCADSLWIAGGRGLRLRLRLSGLGG